MTEPGTAEHLEARVLWLRERIGQLRKRGALVQVSGGIDSTVVLHLCVRALGAEAVTGLFLPDSASSPATAGFAHLAADSAGCRLRQRPITSALATGADDEVTAIIRARMPEYDPNVHAYAVNTSSTMARRLGALVHQVVVGPRHGTPERTIRVSADDLRVIIAAQNRKQRTRMVFAYAEAEAQNLAVIGASNGDELDTGFVVKYGDDAADLCPIGDLSKPEVYALARALQVPQAIIDRKPTTDTFALDQSQSDYYYPMPAEVMAALGLREPEELTDDFVASLLVHCPDWTADGLRQAAAGLRSSLHYQRTRSLRPSKNHEGDNR